MLGYFPRLEERLRQQAEALSGGEQQMLALARAPVSRPRLLLLDEPSLGLAPRIIAEFFAIVRTLNREEGLAVILATSEFEELLGLADVVHVMCLGKVVTTLTAEEATYTKILQHALP